MEITYKRASMKDIDVLVDTRLEALNLAEKTEDSAAMMRRRRQTYSYFRRNLSENQNVAYLVYNGRLLREGTSEELVNDPEVREKYLGENFRM